MIARKHSSLDAEKASSREPRSPIDVHNVGISILAGSTLIVLLRYMQEVIIPFVLSGLIFYALDPFVDWLQHRRVPRAIGAALVLVSVLGAGGLTLYQLSDEALAVVEQMPAATREFRNTFRRTPGTAPGAIETVQQAATELDKTAAEAVTSAPAPPGVVKVQVEQPGFRATDFIWVGSVGMLTVASQGVMIFFLTFFLLVANDLFKRKLVKHLGDTLSTKKITVQILDDIGAQIERFLLVQVLTSAVVAVVTGLALWLLGMKQAAVWGLAAGLFNSVPYFGPVIVTAGLSIIAFTQFGTLPMAAAVAGIALLITTLEGWLLTPTLLGRAARMNQVSVFAGLLFWSWMWGMWGLLLAVPMMMVAKAVCDHVEGWQPIGDFLGD